MTILGDIDLPISIRIRALNYLQNNTKMSANRRLRSRANFRFVEVYRRFMCEQFDEIEKTFFGNK